MSCDPSFRRETTKARVKQKRRSLHSAALQLPGRSFFFSSSSSYFLAHRLRQLQSHGKHTTTKKWKLASSPFFSSSSSLACPCSRTRSSFPFSFLSPSTPTPTPFPTFFLPLFPSPCRLPSSDELPLPSGLLPPPLLELPSDDDSLLTPSRLTLPLLGPPRLISAG